VTLSPAWLSQPPENWPEDAREFYRLCHAILKRAEEGGRSWRPARGQGPHEGEIMPGAPK
jgi:hypothetical protein